MVLNFQELAKRPKEFLCATGLEVNEFSDLLPFFRKAHEKMERSSLTRKGKKRKRKPGGGSKCRSLGAWEDKLLFALVYQKTNPLQAMQGLAFGLSQAQTNVRVHELLPVLREALKEMGHSPEREGSKVSEHLLVRGGGDQILDGTERRRQRPKDDEKQKECYSGKKKAHTEKNLILVHEQTDKVIYLGPTGVGKKHDKKMADEERISHGSKSYLHQDSGFQGYAPAGVQIYQPKKSPRGRS